MYDFQKTVMSALKLINNWYYYIMTVHIRTLAK
jgi:hypothetical protein